MMRNAMDRWRSRDLEDLPDDGQRYEVIDGELFVTPAPSLPHQRAVRELVRILAEYEWRGEGAASSIAIDLPEYFARVLDD